MLCSYGTGIHRTDHATDEGGAASTKDERSESYTVQSLAAVGNPQEKRKKPLREAGKRLSPSGLCLKAFPKTPTLKECRHRHVGPSASRSAAIELVSTKHARSLHSLIEGPMLEECAVSSDVGDFNSSNEDHTRGLAVGQSTL